MTLVQQTSLDAFYEVLDNGTQKTQCLRIMAYLSNTTDATNREISESTRITINAVSARVNMMRRRGLVQQNCVRKCFITKREVNAWRLS